MIESKSSDFSVQRVATGMRTTGELHLGHYVGALKEWKRLQDEGNYECFFLLADVQALTTHADNPSLLTKSVRDVVMDWMSVGLNPNLDRVNFVLQSQIPERSELSQAFTMIAKYTEVLRNPTLKTELKNIKGEESGATMGFMSYPVDQAADIFMVSAVPPAEGDKIVVPVGADQMPHVEYSRLLARRFNSRYGEVFPVCEAIVGETGRLPGISGKGKMSKSLGNAISLSDTAEMVRSKVRSMYTDPNRRSATDPGDPGEDNIAFVYLRAFDEDKDEVRDLEERYRAGRIGDVEVKQTVTRVLNEFMDPIRDRRAELSNANIREIVISGTENTREIATSVVEMVKDKMHLVYPS